MDENEQLAEIGQISIYMAKAGVGFDDLIDPESGLEKKAGLRLYEFVVGDVPCRFFFFETMTVKANPSWLDFINSQLSAEHQVRFRADSHSANGLLLLSIGGRLFAATFGRSASGCLRRKALEPDFGIKTAMNMCGNEEIRQTRTQSNTITPTHIDRQVSRPSDSFVFGLSEAEDLKFISAHMKGSPNVTLQGRDSLTLKVIGSEKLSWDKLLGHCRRLLEAFDSRAYIELFPNYRNFKPAGDAEVEVLDAQLLAALQARDFDNIQLWVPEFLPSDEFSFSYTDNGIKNNTIYSHLDTAQLDRELDLDKISIKKLQAKRVYAYSHEDDRVLSNKRWPLYDCLIFEQQLGGDYYLLNDGRWVQVDPDFYSSIVSFVHDHVREEPAEALYCGIEMADANASKNKEELFNLEACRRRPQSILFDRAKLQIGRGRKDKEFCDILDLTDEGMVRIINCKPYKGASAINYLFSQAKLYCDSFLHDQTFLTEIRDHIAHSNSPTKDDYLHRIAPDVGDVRGEDYQVCLWLLCDRRKTLPTRDNLPLISKYELKLMHDHMRQMCKFRSIVVRFIPVNIVSFTKAAAPRKRAA